MSSELERLRMRVRQLEREVRALRSAAREQDEQELSPAAAFPPPGVLRRRILSAPNSGAAAELNPS